MSAERTGYTFGPLERRGLLGPLALGQVAVLAVGAVLSILVLDESATAAGAIIATASFGAAVALALWPIGLRTAQEWAPLALRFLWRRVRRRGRFRSPAPSAGNLSRGVSSGRPRIEPAPAQPPPALRRVRIETARYRNQQVGVVLSHHGRCHLAILACRVIAFSLLDAEAQERRLTRWGLVLSGASGTSVRRIQWVERATPAQGDELARWLATQRDPEVPLRGTPMIESYLELISSTATVSQEHEILVAVEVDPRLSRQTAGAGGVDELLVQTERIAQALEAAEVRVLGALRPGQVARALRTAFDPYAMAELTALQAADPLRDGIEETGAWPLGTHETWDHYRADGAFHATYWIGGWPRIEVSSMFMDPLLGQSRAVRTVAVTFEPISIERSTRQVEAAITRDRADHDLRRQFGQSQTARQRQAEESAVRREAELAAGHSEVRFAGFVTVSGRDEEELRRGCSEIIEQAARARIELHRMYGQQADAFTFTLPLCRGLR